MMASSRTPESSAFRRFREALSGPKVVSAVRAITGIDVHRVDARAFAYLPGHYLLPHADLDAEATRRIAYAYYVACDDLEGGELELFDCALAGETIVATTPGPRLAPIENRIVLFAVTPSSLHQVREVTQGARLSIAGWFSS
jgi:Rps23 Pro-64 3,4-dihydroxylase Tpa1-like proline 4-hydroxylase